MAAEYGDVVKFRIVNHDWYLLSHPAHIYDVTVTRAALFQKPWLNRRMLEQFTGNGLISSNGDTWRRQHKLVLPGFHRARIDAYGDTMVRLASAMIDAWRPGQRVDFSAAMTDLTMAIVAKCLFDADVKDDARRVGVAMQELQAVMVDHINLPVPVPRWWPSRKNRRKIAALTEIEGIVRGIIEDRRRSGEDRGDLLSMLMFAEDEAGARMSDRELRDEAMTLFFAGHETTSHALSFLWYLLARHPEVSERLRAEVDDALDGRPLGVGDLGKLPYVEMCVKEGMRVLPSVWAFMREPVEDVDIGEYRLPKGCIIFMSPFVTQRRPDVFADPLAFRPERFSVECEKDIPRGAYFPFSLGPRVCIGKSFAMMEARLIVANLIQRVVPTLPADYQLELDPKLAVRPRNGLPVDVVLRSAPPARAGASAPTASAGARTTSCP
jgi:cytochrome P450